MDVGLVLAEQKLGRFTTEHLELAQEGVVDPNGCRAACLEERLRGSAVPRPSVAEPDRRQNVQRCLFRSSVGDADLHEQIQRARLGICDFDDPVSIAVERARVEQLVLRVAPAPPAVGLDQVGVREGCLWVVISPAVPGVAGKRVQVPAVLLDVLAVIALLTGQSEGALLKDRIAPIPERKRETEPLLDVGEPRQAVLAPPVSPGPGVIVRKVAPCAARFAVVLPNRPPLALAQIGAPDVPIAGLMQPVFKLAEASDPVSLSTHRSNS